MASTSVIFSVTTQIEAVIAESMIAEGKATKIELNAFPAEQESPAIWEDAEGNRARFAIVLPRKLINEYQGRIAALRA